MRLPVLTVFVALLTLALTARADVPRKSTVKSLTNIVVQPLPLTDTNTLRDKIEIIRSGTNAVTRMIEVYDDLDRLMENMDKERAMFVGATNLVELSYTSNGETVTIMIVNAYVSKKDAGLVFGRYNIIYPKKWRAVGSVYTKPSKALAPRDCAITYRNGVDECTWSLDLKEPLKGMTEAERTKARKGFKEITSAPLESIKFEPGDTSPVWIADLGEDEKEPSK